MPSLDPATGFTCVTCRLVFKDSELQKDHYKSDWHRYNVKRQVADLPPVSFEQFTSKVVAFKNEREAANQKAEEIAELKCRPCSKVFKSQIKYDEHMKSKKHAETIKNGPKPPKYPRKAKIISEQEPESSGSKLGTKDVEMTAINEEEEDDDDDDESTGWHTDHGTDDEDEDDLDEYDCDPRNAIPVTDCLFCPGSSSSMEESLKHMYKEHGFFVPDEKYCCDMQGLMEYLGMKVGAGRVCIYCPPLRERFGSIESVQQHMRDISHCRLDRNADCMLELAEWYDYSPLYEELNSRPAPVDDGFTLTLPSGAQVGHRLLMRYYKQNIRGMDDDMAKQKLAIDKASGQRLALAWIGGGSGKALVLSNGQMLRVAKDIKAVERLRRRFQLRVAVHSNKLFKTRGRIGDN